MSLKNVKGFSFTAEKDDRFLEMSLCKHIKRLRLISHVHVDEPVNTHPHTHTQATPVNDLLSNHCF